MVNFLPHCLHLKTKHTSGAPSNDFRDVHPLQSKDTFDILGAPSIDSNESQYMHSNFPPTSSGAPSRDFNDVQLLHSKSLKTT